MNYVNMLLKKFGEKKTGLILFNVGLAIGIILSKLLKGLYWNDLDLLNLNYIDYLRNMEIDYDVLRRYVLLKDFKNYILIWALAFTKIGVGSIILILVYYGIQVGFFMSVLLMGYGFRGIVLIFGYTFPQIILYLPILILTFQGGYWLCKSLYYNEFYKKSRVEIIGKYIVFILILGVFLSIGALLETYVGSFILIKILEGF